MIIPMYFRLFTLSQKKTKCYSLTYHTWKMLPHYLVKWQIFHLLQFFTRIKYHQSATWMSCGSVLLRHCWISVEHGGWCSWSMAKKTGSMYPCRRWSLWTSLPAWYSICRTSQPVLFRATNANPQLAFFRATNIWSSDIPVLKIISVLVIIKYGDNHLSISWVWVSEFISVLVSI